jgi:hypothetical protein
VSVNLLTKASKVEWGQAPIPVQQSELLIKITQPIDACDGIGKRSNVRLPVLAAPMVHRSAIEFVSHGGPSCKCNSFAV